MARILTLEAASAQRRGGFYDVENLDSAAELHNFQGEKWDFAKLGEQDISNQLADLALKIADGEVEKVRLVSIALSAPIDHYGKAILSQGQMIQSNLIMPLRSAMKARFPNLNQVVLANRAQMAAWGEFQRGIGRGVRPNLVYFHMGGGIGIGIISNGQLCQGASGYAGEFGHIVVDGSSPQVCPTCDQHGCLVTLVSGRSFVRDYLARSNNVLSRAVLMEMEGSSRERVTFDAGYVQQLKLSGGAGEVDARAIVRAAEIDLATGKPRDEHAHAVVAEAAPLLAKAISYIAYILDPEVVVMGGILSHSSLLNAQLKKLLPTQLIWFNRDTNLELSALSDRADLVGAALWAREKYPLLVRD
jgi:predicted NBD/HSP70 family sugar kinase